MKNGGASFETNAVRGVGAPGRVELPTNGLGNWGFPLHLNCVSNLRIGRTAVNWEESGQTGAIWQRIWQHSAPFENHLLGQ